LHLSQVLWQILTTPTYYNYAIDIVVKLSKLVVARHAPPYYSHTEFSVCFKLQRSNTMHY